MIGETFPDTCRTCSKPINQNPQGATRLYCAEKCRRRARYRRSLGRPEADTAPAPTHCICGKSLAGMNHGAKSCSDRCAYRTRRAAERASTPSPTHCATCQRSLTDRNHGTQFCSRNCRARAKGREERGVPIADPKPARSAPTSSTP